MPQQIDPLQQTVATLLQSLLNLPCVKREMVIEILRFLQRPLSGVQVRELRENYHHYQKDLDAVKFLDAIYAMRKRYEATSEDKPDLKGAKGKPLQEKALNLICFDVLS